MASRGPTARRIGPSRFLASRGCDRPLRVRPEYDAHGWIRADQRDRERFTASPFALTLSCADPSVGIVSGSNAKRTIAPPGRSVSTWTEAARGRTARGHAATSIRYRAGFCIQWPSAVAMRSSSATTWPALIASRTARHSALFVEAVGTDLNTRRSGLAISARTRVPVTLKEPEPRNKRASSPWIVKDTVDARACPDAERREMFVAEAGSSIITTRAISDRISMRPVGSSWDVRVTRYPSASKIGPCATVDRAGAKPSIAIESRYGTGASPTTPPKRNATPPEVALYANRM